MSHEAPATALDAPAAGDVQDSTTASPAHLKSIIIKADEAYGRRKFEDAAELYSQACELQDEINGEMALANADLLHSYGRCLYKVGVSKSDVLGGKAPGEEQPSLNKKRKREATQKDAVKSEQAGELLNVAAEVTTGEEHRSKQAAGGAPLFQLSGDAAEWEDSEEEGAESDGEAGDEEDDDFATAYEILDMARRLFEKQVDAIQAESGKGKRKEGDGPPALRQAREKLADTYDLQSEISLENERFEDAVADGKATLAIKQGLYEPSSRLLAEAHFKLSLALEFASITTEKDPTGQITEQEAVDEAMRDEAASEMEKAIRCLDLHVKALADEIKRAEGDDKANKIKSEKDVIEMIAEMKIRLDDLKAPAASLRVDPSNLLGGVADPAAQAKAAEKAAQAQDISGLVKHKQKPAVSSGPGKRKAEDEESASLSSKKPRVVEGTNDESAELALRSQRRRGGRAGEIKRRHEESA